MGLQFFTLAAIILQVAVSIPVKTSITGLAQESNTVYERSHDGRVGILGGRNITIEQARYVGAIVSNKYHNLVATAVILNNRWIITNAYTIANYLEDDLYVQVGTNNVTKKPDVTFKFEKTIIHPGYDIYNNDIALAKLDNPLTFSRKVGSISIASELPDSGALGYVTAFGMTDQNNGGYLQQVSSPIMDYEECKKRLYGHISELNFCTLQTGVGPCKLDDGAPLVCDRKVVGIYADTFKCGKTPSIYTDMSKFKEWVEDTIEDNTEEGETLEYDDEDSLDDEK